MATIERVGPIEMRPVARAIDHLAMDVRQLVVQRHRSVAVARVHDQKDRPRWSGRLKIALNNRNRGEIGSI